MCIDRGLTCIYIYAYICVCIDVHLSDVNMHVRYILPQRSMLCWAVLPLQQKCHANETA